MKKTIIILLVIILVGVGLYFVFNNPSVPADNTASVQQANLGNEEVVDKTKTVIGKSVDGNDITAYHFGDGDTSLLFIGGMHGGYSWNTSLVAFELMDYLSQNPDSIPQDINVTVIPVLNPDGLKSAVGTTTRFSASDVSSNSQTLVDARFNSNNVDLNRNFDCDWQSKAVWQSKPVSGGSEVFSEPESKALKSYVESLKPAGVVVWYSSAGGVFSSSCHDGVLAKTSEMTKRFADASGYPAHEEYDYYEITGDAVNWLAKINVPAISVLLTNHTDTEWSKNLSGIKAIFAYFAK